MIASKETNSVYFSELLSSDKRFAKTCNVLTDLLEKHSIKYDFLKATKDIWCRDYMPIQIDEENFVTAEITQLPAGSMTFLVWTDV